MLTFLYLSFVIFAPFRAVILLATAYGINLQHSSAKQDAQLKLFMREIRKS